MVASTICIEEWLAATTFVKYETLHSEKNCSLRLNTVTYKVKMLLGTTTLDHSLFL